VRIWLAALDVSGPHSYASFSVVAKTHYPVDAGHVMRELSRVDRRLAKVIRRIGTFPTKKQKPQHPYESLLQAIVYQQLAGKAAATIFGRVKALGANGFPTPEEILQLDETELRGAGLSRQKIAAVKDLAAKTLDGTVPPLATLRRMTEVEIHERLVQLRGIGEWSVQMFLMSRLGRPDVLPVHDLGIRKGFQIVYGHKNVPKPQFILEYGERWRPYRSIASWYLWRAADAKRMKKIPAAKKPKKT
jgi:DNA-3-methyladenine glycosylase II